MNPLVSGYPYVLLLFVYTFACAFSIYNTAHIRYWAKRAKGRNLFVWSLLLPLFRVGVVVTGVLLLLLAFVVILAIEGGLRLEYSGGSAYLQGFRVAMFYVIGITFWVIPFTMYLVAMTLVTSGVRFGDPEPEPGEEPDTTSEGDPLEEEPEIPGVERWKEVRPWEK